CQLPGDQCAVDTECQGYPQYCFMSENGRSCQSGWVCGRPFLVGAAVRLAEAVSGASWTAPSIAPAPAFEGEPDVARRLAEHWTKVALLEHASVAAFARFALQLLSL